MRLTSCDMILWFQSENTHGAKINSLGIYLLISLLFVMAAMVEFAGIMLMQRRNNLNRGNQVESKGQLLGRNMYEMEKLIARIDGFASFGLTLSYIFFNLFYWVPYVSSFWSSTWITRVLDFMYFVYRFSLQKTIPYKMVSYFSKCWKTYDLFSPVDNCGWLHARIIHYSLFT